MFYSCSSFVFFLCINLFFFLNGVGFCEDITKRPDRYENNYLHQCAFECCVYTRMDFTLKCRRSLNCSRSRVPFVHQSAVQYMNQFIHRNSPVHSLHEQIERKKRGWPHVKELSVNLRVCQ